MNQACQWCGEIGQRMNGLFHGLQTPFLLVVRLYWGWMFFLAGKGKLLNLERTTAFFTDLGIPFPQVNAIMAASVECFGGLLLILGLGSRCISVPLSFTMVVAYATAHREELGSVFSDPEKFYSAAPFSFLMACLVILCFGPGKISADYFWERKQAA